ncbi:MAG: efflux RND transporter periplasmic adaptor subunit [Bacteroidia bacterium]|jgi:HlyD family secretion protein|nr:efflux RND transporter periplasmic adaptor subunit [Bacteroidia bacterium]
MKAVKSKNRLIWYLAGAVLLLFVIVIIGKKKGVIGKTEGIKVSIAKAERKTIIESVSANGKIQPEVEVKMSSDVSGEITDLYVKEGDSVRAGTLLARIDPELYQSALDRAEAALNNSKANLANAKARLLQAEAKFTEVEQQYTRNQKMHQQQLISDQEFQASQSAYLTAKADVEASKQTIIGAQYTVKTQEAGLKEARKNLTRTEIFAPVSGIVSKLNVEKGERVVGTSQMAGTEMMRIANLNDMEVSVDVNENDIVKVSIGDTCMVEVDAYNNRKFTGVVTEIANSATTSSATTSDQVTNFVVKIRILRSSYEDLAKLFGSKRSVFRPGMSASVEIQTERKNNVLAVPIEAVTTRSLKELEPDSAITGLTEEVEVVFVVDSDNKSAIQRVSTGVQDDKYIEISGVEEGVEIVSGPYSAVSRTLKSGQILQKVKKEELFEAKEAKTE